MISIKQVNFSRNLGSSVIPSKGLYPLGLGDEETKELCSVDDFTLRRQADLIVRAQSLGLPLKRFGKNSEDKFPELETRQYDYRSNSCNQLFSPLTEDERIAILGAKIHLESKEEGGNFFRDMEHIQANRQNTGCQCKPTKVDKLSIAKMKSELLTRGHLVELTDKEAINRLSKTELITKTRELLKQCPLCVTNACECVLAEVACNAEVCGCIRKFNSTQSQPCANPEGSQIFEPEKVQLYRKSLLADICSECK